MDLTSKTVIKNLLQEHSVHISKRLGQNFLISKVVLGKILEAAELNPQDIVFEVGPGIGTLTKELAPRVERVIAIEKDQKMVGILREVLEQENIKNVEIIQGDVLKYELRSMKYEEKKKEERLQTSDFPPPPRLRRAGRLLTSYRVVANLPYYITSPVIRKFLEAEIQPKEMVLMVQKEVAQRICAKPPDMSVLAVSVQFYGVPEIISLVSKNCFWPTPRVNSAIIKIVPRKSALLSAPIREQFFRIVRAGFSQPRKQLINSLNSRLALDLSNGVELEKPSQISRGETLEGKGRIKKWLEKNNIDPKRRAETLSVQEWINLTKSIKIE